MKKTAEEHFADWEAHAFGYGYGSGEEFILCALRQFFELCPAEGGYDYVLLESRLGGAVAWLLINVLCKVNALDYGTSPRGAWLTPEGRALRDFVLARTVDELVALTERQEGYVNCYPDACNCGPNGYEEGRRCDNPFWEKR